MVCTNSVREKEGFMGMQQGHCSQCGSKTTHKTETKSYTYREKTFTYDQEGLYCGVCGNCDFSIEEAKQAEKKILSFREEINLSKKTHHIEKKNLVLAKA